MNDAISKLMRENVGETTAEGRVYESSEPWRFYSRKSSATEKSPGQQSSGTSEKSMLILDNLELKLLLMIDLYV